MVSLLLLGVDGVVTVATVASVDGVATVAAVASVDGVALTLRYLCPPCSYRILKKLKSITFICFRVAIILMQSFVKINQLVQEFKMGTQNLYRHLEQCHFTESFFILSSH